MCLAVVVLLAVSVIPGTAQEQHDHAHDPQMDPTMNMSGPGWRFMHDGLLTGFVNHQGGPRGVDEARGINWWMGMTTRTIGRDRLTLSAMLSLDAATAGRAGYGEIFQAGETLDGQPVVDRQHPHDLFSQLSASWRMALGNTASLIVAGGPAGEPALGPVAFMHRPSAEAIVQAPLGHHTFDATHVTFGVVTAAVDAGRWTIEGSAFNGREPDDDRWDFDFGRLDSLSGRVWFRPAPAWTVQVSSGRLVEPEVLEPGNITRSTVSVAWFETRGDDMRAAAVGVGVNATAHGRRRALFGELARQSGSLTVSARAEWVEVESSLLRGGVTVPGGDHDEAGHSGPQIETDAIADPVGAFTLGGRRRILAWRGLDAAVGGNLVLYAVPSGLRESHGRFPVSLLAYLQIRPLLGVRDRMWNMRMAR